MVRRVDRAEAQGEIGPWEQIDAETAIIPVGKEPLPGQIVARRQWPAIGATELTLSNGMKVSSALRCSWQVHCAPLIQL